MNDIHIVPNIVLGTQLILFLFYLPTPNYFEIELNLSALDKEDIQLSLFLSWEWKSFATKTSTFWFYQNILILVSKQNYCQTDYIYIRHIYKDNI